MVIPPAFGGFKRRARRISIAGGDVWAFEYPTVSAYDTMRSRISQDGQRIGNATFAWDPHIYGSGRLIVLLMGNRLTPTRAALDEVFGRQFAGV